VDARLGKLDMTEQFADRGVHGEGDVYIRFEQYTAAGTPATAYLDDVRIVTEDLLGPKVLSHAPTGLAGGEGPLDSIVVSFDEPIDPASFTADDVSLKGPDGVTITPVGVSVVGGSNDEQFDLSFAAQGLRGEYRLVVGPEVCDVAGNPMNQDGDGLNGEAGADDYEATVFFATTVWSPPGSEPVLYAEDFETWPTAVPTHWRFTNQGSGTIAAVTSGTPHAGSAHLEFANGSYNIYQNAIMAVDLSTMAGRDDLFLEFWAKKTNANGHFRVYLSGDGQSWHQMLSFDPPTSYTNYAIDLDEHALNRGVALDGDVYIRFEQYTAAGTPATAYLDDVRIVGSPYNAWADSYGLTGIARSMNADPDFDSVPNLLEYGCNMNPTTTNLYYLEPGVGVSGLPAISVTGSGTERRLRVEFIRRRNANDLAYIVEFCSDLTNSPPSGWEQATGAETVTTIDSEWDRVVVEDVLTVETAERRFGRVRFESALE